MLAIATVKDPSYYIDMSNETYQFIGGELPGKWAGTGATLEGLKGEIDEVSFLELMKGIHPSTGVHLYQQNGKNHRRAFDAVLSPDKSRSLAWARANPEQRLIIENIQDESTLEALKFIELHAAFTRRGKDGVRHEKVAGLITAVFQHSTSRENDPQLHSHLTIMNCAKRYDGSYGTIEPRYILKWQKPASLLYNLKQGELFRDIGFDTISSGSSFRIHGIADSICEHYSKRRKQVLGALQAKGIHTARAAALAAKMTRGQKQAIDRPKLFETWQNEMDSLGFSENDFQEILQNSLGNHLPAEKDLTAVYFNHQYLSEILTVSKSIFTEVDVYTAALSTAMKLAVPAKVALMLAETFIESEFAIELQSNSKYDRQFTTHEIRQLEHQMIRNAQTLNKSNFIPGISIDDILIAQNTTGLTLSDEQQEAVLGVLGNSSFEIMSGSAGSGKSTAMKIVNSVYTSKKAGIWGAAIAKDAARNLEKETGIKSFTIAKLLLDLDKDKSKVNSGDVVVIDEAGQVGLRAMSKLQEHSLQKGFKIILTGEDKQLDAIEHGGVLRYLSRTDIVGTTRIETIRRQRKDWDRIAVANLRDGNALEAIKKYHAHGRLNFCTETDTAYEQLVDDWEQYHNINREKGTMVLARTWDDVLELNKLIRQKLQAAGKVSKQDMKIQGVVGSRKIEFMLSKNDRVRFTRNEASLNFTNGDTGTVKNISRDNDSKLRILIQKDSGEFVTVLQNKYSDDKGHIYLAPAYAQTIYSSQGKTIDGDVFVLHDPMIDRANAYVAMSRHKDDCHLYIATDHVIEDEEFSSSAKSTENFIIKKISHQFSTERKAKLSIEHDLLKTEKDFNEELQPQQFEELTM
ncbi:MobF family relaxase [Paraglaciecola arctica]|uniref:MobF family relaxase n=1 Tax=Paraglaciecola arctica TaxID=1128911 RepID=UPI001C076E65|nr:MobF family relaxase [Paraglaciecola arctica]MBU3004280.1 relaxase domain-containing protein [Paraglaciecola arctica]